MSASLSNAGSQAGAPAAILAAAARLREAAATRQPTAPLTDELAGGDLASAYRVQAINTEHGLAAGRRLIGAKIGLTSAEVQRQLGVAEPDFGVLFADMAFPDSERLPLGQLIQPRAEGELAFVLGRDLAMEQPTLVDVIGAIDYVLPAIEIIDSRIANWRIRAVDTIADNASSALFVLGTEPRRIARLDLRLCGMVIERDGEPVSVGAGAACMGHPLSAVTWLARVLASAGRPLRAGHLVLSGALGPVVPIEPGKALELRISGVGSVRTCA